jgi:hypothetical protein
MNSLKSLAMNCGPFVVDDPGSRFRVDFLGALQDDLDVGLGHRLPQIPTDDVSAATIQNAAQVVECSR